MGSTDANTDEKKRVYMDIIQYRCIYNNLARFIFAYFSILYRAISLAASSLLAGIEQKQDKQCQALQAAIIVKMSIVYTKLKLSYVLNHGSGMRSRVHIVLKLFE